MRLKLACTCAAIALLAGSNDTGIADFGATPAMASAVVVEPGAVLRPLESGTVAIAPKKSDRLALAPATTPKFDAEEPTARLEPESKATETPEIEETSDAPAPRRALSRQEMCDTVASAAQAHELPPKFFMRLLWQESKLNPNAVSPAGAQGIAQFMPRIAAAFGVKDPFDPTQALPASARFLRSLLDHFGNLGLAAAAYNGGHGRIENWLHKKGKLPQETRTYVLNITGQAPERWVGSGAGDFKLDIPARAPCQDHVAFARDANTTDGENTALTEVSSPQGKLLIASNARTQRVLKKMQATETGRATLSDLASKAKARSTSVVVASLEKRQPASSKAAKVVQVAGAAASKVKQTVQVAVASAKKHITAPAKPNATPQAKVAATEKRRSPGEKRSHAGRA
jgi:Transglycosylase SLT domain